MIRSLVPAGKKALPYIAALACIVLIYSVLCISSGVDPASYIYKTYLIQAQSWLDGRITVDGQYLPYLELAIHNGNYYVSFPPVPSIPMLLYALIWGNNVPGGLFQKIYVAAACMLILSELLRRRKMQWPHAVAWSVFFCFASAMLPVTLVGGVWYEAQTLAFLLSTAAVVSMLRGRSTLSCLMYALSVGCRPFTVCLGPVMLMLYIRRMRRAQIGARQAFRRLLPGLIAGLLIAAAYAAYNYARFGNPLEFGHNHLPEFSTQGGKQFALAHIPQNAKWLFTCPPFRIQDGAIVPEMFGSSMFFSCPVFICWLVWIIKDLFRRRMTPPKLVIIAMFCLNTFLLLMHRTMGGMQFGARYAVEMIPLCFAYFMLCPERKQIARWECVLMSFGLVLNLIGACLVHV